MGEKLKYERPVVAVYQVELEVMAEPPVSLFVIDVNGGEIKVNDYLEGAEQPTGTGDVYIY
jgi:hypothetical protein